MCLVRQEETFERFWEDCVLKVRNVGIPEMRVNKQLENIQKVAFRDMISYDKGKAGEHARLSPQGFFLPSFPYRQVAL
jgi:hypothetical protein